MPSRVMAAEISASTASTFAGARASTAGIDGDAATGGEAGVVADGDGDGDGDGDCASTTPRASVPSAGIRTPSLQPVLVLQLLRQVLLGDEADAVPRERLDLELEPASHHLLDLALPLG